MMRAAAKPAPKPKAMVPMPRRPVQQAPITPGIGDRPAVRPAPAKGLVSSLAKGLAPLTPALVAQAPGRPSASLRATSAPLAHGAVEDHGDDSSAPLPPKRPPPVRQQVESHFTDQGLRMDRYLSELISESPGGWVTMEDVMGLRRVKALRTTPEAILHALRDSWLEIFEDEDGDSSSAAIRRPPGRALPKLQDGPPIATKQPARVADRGKDDGHRQTSQLDAKPPPAAQQRRTEAPGRPLFPGRLRGTVRSYDEESGSATLACPQTQALFQQDVSVGWRELEEAGVALDIGTLVSFLVELGTNGQPTARDLQLRAPDDDDDEDEEEAPRPPKRAKVTATVGGRYTGTIKSFHEGVGLGFIACKATYVTFGRDVSLDRSELSGFEVGDAISFELAVDPQLGRPRGVSLEAPSTGPPPPSGPPPKTVTPANSKVGPPKKPAPAPAALPSGGKRWKGVVESVDDVKGVGRIACVVKGATRHCSVDDAELAGFIAGDSVSFRLVKQTTGGPKAFELEAEAP